MNQISLISPISDAEAARAVSPDTHADLTQRIMTTAVEEAGQAPARRAPVRRRLLIGIPVAACLAVAALIATSLAGPGQRVGPLTVGPAKADALSFVRHGGYIDVVVRNPLADEKSYRAEFAAHHLDITLSLVPVSPSLVGTLVYWGGSSGAGGITTITAKGRCWTGGGGSECPVGVRIPDGFHGDAQFVFGRAARPGEQYESTGLVTAPGEAMHGLNYQGKTVAAVLAMLRARHVTVAAVRSMNACQKVPAHIPGIWRVYQADPWAPGQVLLWVGRAGAHCSGAAAGKPTPKASPMASAAPQPVS